MPNQVQDKGPLFATQGGGIATFMDGKYVWHELPDWMEALPDGDSDKQKVGEQIPDEWDIQPINEVARQQLLDEQYPHLANEYPDDFSDFLDPAGF